MEWSSPPKPRRRGSSSGQVEASLYRLRPWLAGLRSAQRRDGLPSGRRAGRRRPAARAMGVRLLRDDILATVAALEGRGVEFTGEVTEQSYGLITYIKVPGGLTVMLYQRLYR